MAGGGFGRKLGTDVKVLVAVHHVPGHYCLAFVDFKRERFLYADPLDVDSTRGRGLSTR